MNLCESTLVTETDAASVSEQPKVYAWVCQTALLVASIGLLYHRILSALALAWWSDPNFSHGFFVPLFSLFVVWKDRKKLSRIPRQPSWTGLLVIIGGLSLLIVGALGAELFLSRSSLLFLLAGLIVYFAGWSYFRFLIFPWAVLFLMLPIPVIIYNEVVFPLQLLASRVATSLLNFVGVPVLREGNVLTLPDMALEVAEACSGIRSLISLITLAIFYGYVTEVRNLRRVILVVAAVPIAVVANGLRIMGTGLLGEYWNPDKAEGFFHSFSGWIIFLLSLAMLYILHNTLNTLWRSPAETRRAF